MSTITASEHDRAHYSASAIRSIDIPDSKLCRRITELVRDTESDLLFNHSSRVYCFAALTGLRRGLPFDRELGGVRVVGVGSVGDATGPERVAHFALIAPGDDGLRVEHRWASY